MNDVVQILEAQQKTFLREYEEKKKKRQAMRVLTSSETSEWYTPPEIADPARDFMGGIDLDPASCEAANTWIKAGAIFTEADDGLSLPWFGRVWLNPPYGKVGNRSNQDIWAAYLEGQYFAGNVTMGILLTKCVPGYAWFERLFRNWPVLFVRERIEFIQLDETGEVINRGRSKAGSNLWFIGSPGKFIEFRETFETKLDMGRVIFPPMATVERNHKRRIAGIRGRQS